MPLLRYAQSRNVTGLVSLPLLPLSNASKVDNLLLSAVPSLNYVASAFPEKKTFPFAEGVFDVYGHFTKMDGSLKVFYFKNPN